MSSEPELNLLHVVRPCLLREYLSDLVWLLYYVIPLNSITCFLLRETICNVVFMCDLWNVAWDCLLCFVEACYVVALTLIDTGVGNSNTDCDVFSMLVWTIVLRKHLGRLECRLGLFRLRKTSRRDLWAKPIGFGYSAECAWQKCWMCISHTPSHRMAAFWRNCLVATPW